MSRLLCALLVLLLSLNAESLNFLLYGVCTPFYSMVFMNYTQNIREYSRMHGYTYDTPSNDSFDSNHHPTAYRMYKAYNYLIGNYSLQDTTQQQIHHDWIVYLDTDIFIAEKSIPLTVIVDAANKYLNQSNDCHFIAQDGRTIVNSGFWMIRNSTQSLMFIKNWIREFELAESIHGINSWNYDQGALSQMILHYVASMTNNTYHSVDCADKPHKANKCYDKTLSLMGAPYMHRKIGNLCLIPPVGVPYQFHTHKDYKTGELVYHMKGVNASVINRPGLLDFNGSHIVVKNGSLVHFYDYGETYLIINGKKVVINVPLNDTSVIQLSTEFFDQFETENTAKKIDLDNIMPLIEKSHVNKNKNARDSVGLLQRNTNESKFIQFVEDYANPGFTFTNNENVDAVERYFWGLSGGIVLEMGAVDGLVMSMSRSFLDIGWSRILIEGAPNLEENLVKNSPDADSFILAACDAVKYVHFVEATGIGGILEFMSDSFRNMFHRQTFYLPVEQWYKIPGVKSVLCVPLHYVFSYLNVTRINFWILDLEGAELSVLNSVDWNSIQFDVICVETERALRRAGYQEDVTAYLQQRGYSLSWEYERNSWYTHKAFNASSRPEMLRYTRNDGSKNYPSGTVVKLEGHRNKALYVMFQRKKYLIPSWDVYLSSGLDKKYCASLTQAQFDSIPTGEGFPAQYIKTSV